jgi:hypothetical protein
MWKAEPFRKFTVHLADGRDVAVRHQEFLMLSPNGRTMVVYQPDGGFNIIDLLLVTDLELGVNGRAASRTRRRRR